MIFSIMVPLTYFAFELGVLSINDNFFVPGVRTFDTFDGLGGALVIICVFFFNFLEEKPQKTSIEHL
jgi:hypothetical protein